MATVRQIYDIALSLIDEEGSTDFERRTPGIVNTLIGRCYNASEEYETGPHSMWTPVSSMDDEVEGIDQTLALSAMPNGLASYLVLDYDPVKARSLWSVFLEQVELCRKSPGRFEAIDDVYGGIEYGDFARW